MVWWGWILMGSFLLCSEILFVDTGFYLFFFGVAALLVGVFALGVPEVPLWAQWLLFAALNVLLLMLLRRRLYEKLRGGAGGARVASQPVRAGDTGTAESAIAPGARGRAAVGGSTWTVHNAGAHTIAAGAGVRVREAAGMVLHVEPAPANAAPAPQAPASTTPAREESPHG